MTVATAKSVGDRARNFARKAFISYPEALDFKRRRVSAF